MTRAAIAFAIAHVTANSAGHPTLREHECSNYARIVVAEAARFRVDGLVLVALVSRESSWKARAVNKRTGAVGLGQLMPGTDATKGFDGYDLTDPAVNLHLTARRLSRFQRLVGPERHVAESTWLAVSGYNGLGVKRVSPFAREVMRIYEGIVAASVNR